MKRLFALFTISLLSVVTLCAQEKVKEERIVSSIFDRPSVSYVLLNRSWSHSNDVIRSFDSFKVGEKYDENKIKTKRIDAGAKGSSAVTSTTVLATVNELNLGKEVISYIFNRQDNGNFDDTIVRERGIYNAKDQDIQNLAAAKVTEQSFEWGEPLVNSAFVVVLDVYETKQSKSNGTTTYEAKCTANVFKLKADKEILYDFYGRGWADVSSSDDERANAKEAYDQMQFDLEYITTVDVTGTTTTSKYSKGSIYDSCVQAYNNAVFKLEKTIPSWRATGDIVSVRPIAAKIGTKESVKNGDRFQTYSYKEDRNGKLKAVKQGMVRATVVANNKGVATGNTKPSYFYQISGFMNVKEGYALEQKNDWKIGAALTVGENPLGTRAGLDFDYLINISKHGFITYGMLNVGASFTQEENLLLDIAGGFGYGMPITRFAEITPSIMVGGLIKPTIEDATNAILSEDDDSESAKFVGYFVDPGVRLALTIQPLSIFVSTGYQLNIPTEPEVELGSGTYVKAGIKWTF